MNKYTEPNRNLYCYLSLCSMNKYTEPNRNLCCYLSLCSMNKWTSTHNPMGICVVICLYAVWTSIHNPMGICVVICLCAVWTRLYKYTEINGNLCCYLSLCSMNKYTVICRCAVWTRLFNSIEPSVIGLGHCQCNISNQWVVTFGSRMTYSRIVRWTDVCSLSALSSSSSSSSSELSMSPLCAAGTVKYLLRVASGDWSLFSMA